MQAKGSVEALVDKLNSVVGLGIVEIKYVKTKFENSQLSFDWTNVDPDRFVLHAKEWQIRFSNEIIWYVTNPQGDLTYEPLKSNLRIDNGSIADDDDLILTVPDKYAWKDFVNNDSEIIGFRFWQRVTSTSGILGFKPRRKYQGNVQILELLFNTKSFAITTMAGDIGEIAFYPRGSLGDRPGIFLNKRVADSHSVYGLEMKFQITHETISRRKHHSTNH